MRPLIATCYSPVYGLRLIPSASAGLARKNPALTLGVSGKGFTLIELIVVMVVISLVLALAAPSLRGFFEGRQTADAAENILAFTRMARSQAVARGTPARFNFDEQAGTYWLTVQDQGRYVQPGTDMGRVFTLPEGVSMSVQREEGMPGRPYIQFYPSGRNDGGTITVSGKTRASYVISCQSATEGFAMSSASEGQGQ